MIAMRETAFACEELVRVNGEVLEGPCWDAGTGRLLFVDIPAGEVFALDWLSQRVERTLIGESVSAVIPKVGGGEVLACRRGIAMMGADGLQLVLPLESDRPWTRTNDAKCDPLGRLWVGTMADDGRQGAGSLYRVSADWRCETILDGVTISNGLGWDPDGTRMYYVDSATRRIDVFDYDVAMGVAARRRTLIDTAELAGLPDGMAVDEEGCLWVAFYGGSAVCRFSPDGSPLAVVQVPAPNVTSCAFAGPGLDRLVITTAGAGAGDQGGDVFVAEPGVRGMPTVAFAC